MALIKETPDVGLILMDRIENHVVTLTEKLAEIAEKYGPDVINLGLDVVRLTGAAPLFLGLVCAIATPILIWSSFHWCRKFEAAPYEDQDVCLFGAVPSIGFSLVTFIISLITLLDFWNWVAVFYPVAYLARKVMGLD